MRKWPLILLGLLVVLIGGRFIYGVLNHQDDKQQIKAALQDAIKASREGRPGGVVELLANNFEINGVNPDIRQMADFIKRNHPEVTIPNQDPVINGDTAQITSDVAINVTAFGQSQHL